MHEGVERSDLSRSDAIIARWQSLWGFRSTSSRTNCGPSMTNLESGTDSSLLSGMKPIGLRNSSIDGCETPNYGGGARAAHYPCGLGNMCYSPLAPLLIHSACTGG